MEKALSEALIDTRTPETVALENEAEEARKETFLEIIGMIEQLPAKQREVVRKFLIEEKSLKEIAKELGIKYETARYRLISGLDKLRALIRRRINFEPEFKELIITGFGEGWLDTIRFSK